MNQPKPINHRLIINNCHSNLDNAQAEFCVFVCFKISDKSIEWLNYTKWIDYYWQYLKDLNQQNYKRRRAMLIENEMEYQQKILKVKLEN